MMTNQMTNHDHIDHKGQKEINMLVPNIQVTQE